MLIVIRLSGGLGNQIFQYAKGLSLSKKYSCDLRFLHKEFFRETPRARSITEFESIRFVGATELHYRLIRIRWIYYLVLKYVHKFRIVRELDLRSPNFFLEDKFNYFIDGYWQDLQSIIPVEEILRNSLCLSKSFSSSFSDYRRKIESSKNSVSIHVRKTDFLKGKNRNIFCDISSFYYTNAIKCLEESVEGEFIYFVFGDDLAWLEENVPLKGQYVHVMNNSPAEDVILMSLCKFNITSNSTLSFWGAWLNVHTDKIIITPSQWKIFESVTFIPKSWIKL